MKRVIALIFLSVFLISFVSAADSSCKQGDNQFITTCTLYPNEYTYLNINGVKHAIEMIDYNENQIKLHFSGNEEWIDLNQREMFFNDMYFEVNLVNFNTDPYSQVYIAISHCDMEGCHLINGGELKTILNEKEYTIKETLWNSNEIVVSVNEKSSGYIKQGETKTVKGINIKIEGIYHEGKLVDFSVSKASFFEIIGSWFKK